MDAAVLELDSRAGDQVFDGARDEDFARACRRRDPRAHMDGDAGDPAPVHLAFAGVKSCTDRQPNRLDDVSDGRCAPDGPRWPVERREEAVTGGIHFSTAKPFVVPADTAAWWALRHSPQ